MREKREEIVLLIKNRILRASKSAALDKIGEELCVAGKFTVLDFNNIRINNLPLEDLEDAELYWIIDAASKYLDTIRTAEHYFEDAEIERYKCYVRNDNKIVGYPLLFHDVVKLADNQYAFPCSVGEIARLKYSGMLKINPELQREGKLDKYGDMKVYINPRRVKELKELYENKEYSYNSIRFNLMDDGEAEFEYKDDMREIIIYKGTIVVPDGNHRALATELVDPKKSCVEERFVILFTFFTAARVKQTISQEWNVQPVNKFHKDYMRPSNSNKIVDAIKRNMNSDPLYVKKIVTTGREIYSGDGFILYDTLSKSIQRYYNADRIETQDERAEIAEWISIFLNKLTVLLLNDFKHYREAKNTRWSVNPDAFVGYILLSSYLKGRENWRFELQNIIEKIDFNIERSPLFNKPVKSNAKTMEMFFERMAKDAGII